MTIESISINDRLSLLKTTFSGVNHYVPSAAPNRVQGIRNVLDSFFSKSIGISLILCYHISDRRINEGDVGTGEVSVGLPGISGYCYDKNAKVLNDQHLGLYFCFTNIEL